MSSSAAKLAAQVGGGVGSILTTLVATKLIEKFVLSPFVDKKLAEQKAIFDVKKPKQ